MKFYVLRLVDWLPIPCRSNITFFPSYVSVTSTRQCIVLHLCMIEYTSP
jgi:hypothetical protein